MLNICLIGYGRWGKLLYKRLNKITKIIKILNSKNYSIKELKNADWIVIATPNNTHYKIIKDCLKNKKNIFCEKPLVLKYSRAVELYNIAEKNNLKIIVSDLSDYKKDIQIKRKDNLFQRFKHMKEDSKIKIKRYDLLYRFCYHDIGYIYKKIYQKKINLIRIISSKPSLKFLIRFGDQDFTFHYDTQKNKKIYTFNKNNLFQKNDIIKKMFTDYLYNKKSYKLNKKKSLYIIKLLEKIRHEI